VTGTHAHRVGAWHADGRFAGSASIARSSGIAPADAAASFVVSTDEGALWDITFDTPACRLLCHDALHWDNHLYRIG
jgi:hypothetical protein